VASTSYAALGNYTSTWASLYSISFPPEIYQEWFQRYGEGFKILDFLRMFGRTQTVANRVFYHFEDAAEQRVCTLADNGSGDGIDTGGAGVTRTIKLAASDYDASSNGPLREHFTVLIPKAYQHADVGKDRWYIVTATSGSGSATEYTLTPTDDDARIGTAVPVGTEILIGPSHFAAGTGQPDGMAVGTYRRTHNTHIVKEAVGFEGGQIAQRSYREQISQAKLKNGGTGLFDKGTVETEFRLDDQIDSALFIGEENDNTSVLVQTSQAGGSNARTGTKGIWNWQTELAQSLSYIDDFDMDYFDQVKPLLQSQGVVDTTVLFCYGTNLGLKVENGVLEALKEWSGGTDLTKGNMFGVNFKSVMKNGVNFLCKELASFANPNKLGNASYQFADAGMMIPVGYSTVSNEMNGAKQTVPNISICFYNHNGEDRTRIVGTVAGMNGMGYQIVDQYDRTNVYMLSEFATFAANVNQHIQITKS
jgi:hypothetical protein